MMPKFVYDNMGFWKGGYIIVASAITVVLIVVAICLAVATVSSHECALASRELKRPSSYHFLGGCYVGVGGQKVPLENYNAFRQAK